MNKRLDICDLIICRGLLLFFFYCKIYLDTVVGDDKKKHKGKSCQFRHCL